MSRTHMRMKPRTPVQCDEDLPAVVRLARGKEVNSWVIDECPYCGGQHWHGAGLATEDPRRLLGSRSAHCNEGAISNGYVLVERPANTGPESAEKP